MLWSTCRKVAVRCDFFVKSLLHFSKFLVSIDIFLLRKYWKLFTHKLNTFALMNELQNAIQSNGQENPQNLPFTLLDVDPSNTPMPGSTPFTLQVAARLLHALLHNYATKSPLLTMGCPKFTPIITPSLEWSPPHLIYPSLNQLHSSLQTTSRSNQPFFHNSSIG